MKAAKAEEIIMIRKLKDLFKFRNRRYIDINNNQKIE